LNAQGGQLESDGDLESLRPGANERRRAVFASLGLLAASMLLMRDWNRVVAAAA
jgi:hypothetical protein